MLSKNILIGFSANQPDRMTGLSLGYLYGDLNVGRRSTPHRKPSRSTSSQPAQKKVTKRNQTGPTRGKGTSTVGALRESEAQFHLLIEAVVDYAIFMLDPRGRVATWNAGAKRIKGYEASEIIGKPYSIFFPEQDVREGKPQRHLAVAAREGRLEEEGWRVRKNGTQFWANAVLTSLHDAKGVLRGFVKVTRDRTEQKRAEDALRQSEQWLLTTLRSIGDGVIATDTAGKVKFLNPRAEVLTGWQQEEVKTMHLDTIFKIINEQTRQPVTSPFFKVVASGGVVGLANDTVLVARDGSERVIEDSGAPIFNQAGQIDGVVLVFRERPSGE